MFSNLQSESSDDDSPSDDEIILLERVNHSKTRIPLHQQNLRQAQAVSNSAVAEIYQKHETDVTAFEDEGLAQQIQNIE